MKLRKMEIPERQIVQKQILNKKLSLQVVARDNGIFLNKLRQILEGQVTTTPQRINNLIEYVNREDS